VFGSVLIGPHLKLAAGSLAEYVAVAATSVVRKPDRASFEEAAGLPVAGCVALTLIDAARLKAGDTILVNGASGGIGTIVVQLAKKLVGESGRVVAICSGRNVELVNSLGADEVKKQLSALGVGASNCLSKLTDDQGHRLPSPCSSP
jgi:NADPH:quinone reductase-like Zn-dependent oxidoreductase